MTFRGCVFLGPVISNIVMMQKLGMYLEQIGFL